MSWFPFSTLIDFAFFSIYILLIYIILEKNSSSNTNKLAAILFLLFALWSLGRMFLHNSGTPAKIALLVEYFDAIIWTTFPVIILTFMLSLTNLKTVILTKRYIFITSLAPIFFLSLHWMGLLRNAPFLDGDIWVTTWIKGSIFPYLYYLYLIGVIVTGMIIILKEQIKSNHTLQKKQLFYINIFSTLALILGILTEVVFPLCNIHINIFKRISNIYLFVLAIGFFYVIIRYRFLALTPYSAAESIIVSLNEALILVDDEIKINYANKITLEMLGYKESRLIGHPLSILFFDNKVFNTFLKSVITESSYKNIEIMLKKSDGTALPCMFSASIIKEFSEMRGMVCVATDITQQNKVKQELIDGYAKLKELDTLKSNFTSMVSHELRTPITSIKGFISFLMAGVGGPLSKQQREFLETIRNNSDRLLNLINDLLDTSKMESGSFSIVKVPFNLVKIVDNSIRDVHSISEKKNIRLERIFKDAVYNIKADDYRISQALINLINNAIKFSPVGSKITVQIESKQLGLIVIPDYADKSALRNCTYAVITIKDEGPGIEHDKLVKIFDRFYQIENINTRSSQGTGLGLNIVKNIIELHGGAVWAESNGTGFGSSFIIIIPEE